MKTLNAITPCRVTRYDQTPRPQNKNHLKTAKKTIMGYLLYWFFIHNVQNKKIMQPLLKRIVNWFLLDAVVYIKRGMLRSQILTPPHVHQRDFPQFGTSLLGSFLC